MADMIDPAALGAAKLTGTAKLDLLRRRHEEHAKPESQHPDNLRRLFTETAATLAHLQRERDAAYGLNS